MTTPPSPRHPDRSPAPGEPRIDSALPPRGARILAFASILVAGLCGGLIGMAFTELQCTGECAVPVGIGTLTGATMAAGGVAVVAVLVLRAMGEWHTIREARDRKAAARPPKAARPGASNGSTENGKSTPNGGGSGNPPHDHSA